MQQHFLALLMFVALLPSSRTVCNCIWVFSMIVVSFCQSPPDTRRFLWLCFVYGALDDGTAHHSSSMKAKSLHTSLVMFRTSVKAAPWPHWRNNLDTYIFQFCPSQVKMTPPIVCGFRTISHIFFLLNHFLYPTMPTIFSNVLPSFLIGGPWLQSHLNILGELPSRNKHSCSCSHLVVQ